MNTRALEFHVPIETADGDFHATFTEIGLRSLDFPKAGRLVPASSSVPKQVQNWAKVTSRALRDILRGKAPTELPPMDWTGATDFQQSVWRALNEIRAGSTRSYAEIAKDLGRPGAARAVGGACGANPIPVLTPCHRVLAAGQKLGGFSGGLPWKIELLKREGVLL